MPTQVTLDRETVLDLMKHASTLQDVARAKAVRDEWLHEHPADEEVLQLSAVLFRVEVALRGTEGGALDAVRRGHDRDIDTLVQELLH